MPGRSSIREVTRPWRSRYSWSPGTRGERPCPPGPAPGSGRPWSCATAIAGATPARACCRRVRNVEETIGPEIDGMEATEQAVIDQTLLELDGTPNKSALGANAILAVSLAVARAAADAVGLPLYAYLGGVGGRLLPVPLMNVINGGAHADNGLDIQEFMLVPAGRGELLVRAAQSAPRSSTRSRASCASKGLSTGVGDEGGFAPALGSNTAALDLLMQAIERAGYRPGRRCVAGPRRGRERVCRGGRALSTAPAKGWCARARKWSRPSRASSSVTRSSRWRTASARTTGTDGRA